MFNVQFITHFTEKYSYLDSAYLALEGGCRWIQLRMKDEPDEIVEQVALQVQGLCRRYGATFIIDDRVELACKLRADGVHLGKNDMPVSEARAFLGSGFLIGGTANTYNDIRMHVDGGADYIGCGPFRFTATKQKLSPVLGLEGYQAILKQVKAARLSIPIVGIGGITIDDIPGLQAVGLDGIALSGSVLRATDPIEEMKRIIKFTQ